MKFAEQLKYYRKNRGLTQHQLAVKVGVSDGAMSNYEQGTRTPDYETLEAIADELNVSIDALMGKEESENEIEGVLEYLKNREEGKMLFSALKGATKQDIITAARIIEEIRTHR